MAETQALLRGYDVARPSIDNGVDLIINGKTVQVKYGAPQNRPNAGSKANFIFGMQGNRGADFYALCGYTGKAEPVWWIIPGEVIREIDPPSVLCIRPGAGGRSKLVEWYIGAWHLFATP